MKKTYIVSRHSGTIEWLNEHGITGYVISQLDNDHIYEGCRYIGNLPVTLIFKILQAGSEYYHIDLPQIAFSQRGTELTPKEMDSAGARLVKVVDLKIWSNDLWH